MDYRGIEILLLSLGEKLSIDANNNMDPFFFFFGFTLAWVTPLNIHRRKDS